jgi:hypothetical protein
MQVFPPDNPWNEDITRRPLLSNSDGMIGMINSELLSTRRTLRAFFEMNFVLVPNQQPLVPISFLDYADESIPVLSILRHAGRDLAARNGTLTLRMATGHQQRQGDRHRSSCNRAPDASGRRGRPNE